MTDTLSHAARHDLIANGYIGKYIFIPQHNTSCPVVWNTKWHIHMLSPTSSITPGPLPISRSCLLSLCVAISYYHCDLSLNFACRCSLLEFPIGQDWFPHSNSIGFTDMYPAFTYTYIPTSCLYLLVYTCAYLHTCIYPYTFILYSLTHVLLHTRVHELRHAVGVWAGAINQIAFFSRCDLAPCRPDNSIIAIKDITVRINLWSATNHMWFHFK